MATFKDQNNREWLVTLDAPKIREVRSTLQLDLAAVDDRPYERMYDDTVLLVDVLWILCREQAQKANVTDEQFGQALVGDAVEKATDAMLAAMLDFFPKTKRELLQALADKTKRIREASMRKAMDRLNDPSLEEKLLAAMDAQTEQAIQNVLTQLNSATNSPASSESAPTA